jgi:hypothetical protein
MNRTEPNPHKNTKNKLGSLPLGLTTSFNCWQDWQGWDNVCSQKDGKVGKMRKAVLYFVGKGGSSTLEEHMAEVATALKFYSMY